MVDIATFYIAGLYVYWAMVGMLIGSFLGVLIDRIPLEQSVIRGRSHCDFCKRTLRWYELIPVFSYLFQGGRCLRCHKKLSWRYPVYEISTGIMFSLLWHVSNYSLGTFAGLCIVGCSLLVIFVIDLDHMIIPDVLEITTLIGTGIYLLFSGHTLIDILRNNFPAAVVSFLLFYGLWIATNKKGLGFGDVYLSFVLGFLVGFPQVVVSLYAAFLTGAAVAVILLVYGRKKMKSAVPFGPFLILGAVLSFFVNSHAIVSYFL